MNFQNIPISIFSTDKIINVPIYYTDSKEDIIPKIKKAIGSPFPELIFVLHPAHL